MMSNMMNTITNVTSSFMNTGTNDNLINKIILDVNNCQKKVSTTLQSKLEAEMFTNQAFKA